MSDPYIPPSKKITEPTQNRDTSKLSSGCMGCFSGGCLLPILLFFACAIFLGDTGGPLFWPIIAVPLGLIGLAVGLVVGSIK